MRKIFIATMMILFVMSAYAADVKKTAPKPAVTAEASTDLVPLPPRAKSYERYTEMFAIYGGNGLAKIVMLGDSITQGAYWNELMHRGDIINRGIPGDTTQGMLERLETVTVPTMEKAFILAGINDIAKHQTVQNIYDRYVRIVEFLVRMGIKPHIQSTLYLSVKNPNYAEVNKLVVNLNKMLKDYAGKNAIEYIDLNAALSNGTEMVDDYSYDGTHLNAKGYLIWRAVLSKYIEPQYNLPEPDSAENGEPVTEPVQPQN